MRRCQSRHRKCWIIAGGYWLWCYECGAIRRNVPAGTPDPDTGKPERWVYPVGPEGENPALRLFSSTY